MSKKDFYAILGVSKDATKEEIEKAYKKLARTKHPDKGGSSEEFVDIQKAYSTLKDQKSRRMYDAGFDAETMGDGFGQGGGFNGGFQGDFSGFRDFGGFEDIFKFFGEGGGNGSRSRGRKSSIKGQDIECKAQISLEEAFRGLNINVSYYKLFKCNTCNGSGANKSKIVKCSQCRGSGAVDMFIFGLRQACSTCNGTGTVISACSDCDGNKLVKAKVSKSFSIPAGVENDQKLIFKSLGNDGIDAENGNLVITIAIRKHNIFTRDRDNLIVHKEVPISTMIFGGKIKLNTIDGQVIEAEVKRYSKTNDQVIIRDHGMPKYKTSSKGNLHVILTPTIPDPNKMNEDEINAWQYIYEQQNHQKMTEDKKGFFR